VSQANSQVPPSFWRVFEESAATQRAIQQVAEAVGEHVRKQQSQMISQTQAAMVADIRAAVARSQQTGIASVAEAIAKVNINTAQLDRLTAVVSEALRAEWPAAQVAHRVEQEVPAAAPVMAPLLKDGGVPLATWLALLVAVLTFLLHLQESQEQPAPAITPDQVTEIITRVVDEVDEREQRSGR
jgi:hypothetical protein